MTRNKLTDIFILKNKILSLKDNKKIIGLTNGCFDLLHKGHISLIIQSKKMCDYLIVAINSDMSVKKLKGNDRPYDNIETRIKNLSDRKEVDSIIVFNEFTPLSLISELKPDILFKGSDYKKKEVVGSGIIINNGGKVEFIDILSGFSTTNIINNLKKTNINIGD